MQKTVILFGTLVLAAFTSQSGSVMAQQAKSTNTTSTAEKKVTASSEQEKEVPFACSLTALTAAEREHHRELSKQLRAAVKEIKELPNGYGFRLPGERQTVSMLAEWVSLERLCCPFFTFQLEIGSDGKPIWLRITGREGVKQFMQTEFGIK